MKKLLSLIGLCLTLSTTCNAMKRDDQERQLQRELQQIVEHSLIEALPDDVACEIVYFLDYHNFIAFSLGCHKTYQICVNVPQEYLASIVIQAAEHGNKNLVCRYLGLPPENMLLKKCAENIFFLGCDDQSNHLLIPLEPSAQECKDALLIAIEFTTPSYFEKLLTNEKLAALIDQDCADAVVTKCTELQRLDLRQILCNTHEIYSQMSLDVMFSLMNMREEVDEVSEIEEVAISDDETDDELNLSPVENQ